jgi:hypothetical protein
VESKNKRREGVSGFFRRFLRDVARDRDHENGGGSGRIAPSCNLRKLPPFLVALPPAQVARNSRHRATEILY